MVEDSQGLFPDLVRELEEFETMVSWKKIGNERIPEPTKGIDDTFDQANDIVNEIKNKLNDILLDVRKNYNSDPNM